MATGTDLEDDAYRSPDAYAGRAGPPWLQRWATTRGVPFSPEPRPDGWVRSIAYPD